MSEQTTIIKIYIDEYQHGSGGYGFAFEGTTGEHAIFNVHPAGWARRVGWESLDFEEKKALTTNPVNFSKARGILSWLAGLHFSPDEVAAVSTMMTPASAPQDQQPGLGLPGTEDWAWHVVIVMTTTPQYGKTLLTVLLAMPAKESMQLGADYGPVVRSVRTIARRALLVAHPDQYN